MKTISLKKVSAVAVASLGFGLLSVVPAQAAQTAQPMTAVNAILATANTGATNEAQVIFVGATIAATTDVTNGETIVFKAAATSYPTNGFIGVTGLSSVTGTFGTSSADVGAANGVTVTQTGASTVTTLAATGAGAATALAGFSLTPTVAGAYTITIWNDVDEDDVIDTAEARTNVALTVTGAAKLSAGLSTVHLTAVTGTAADATTSTVPVRVTRALGTTAKASLTVTLRDTLGAVLTTVDGYTLTATVSGDAGGVGSVNGIVEAATPTFAGQCPATQPIRLVQAAAAYNAVSNVYFCSSNQSGSSTITITATDADGVITTIGSRTINYFGSVATLEVTPILSVVRSAGGTTGDATATRIATTAPAAYKVVAKDSAGQLVGGLAAGISATPTTTIGSVTCAEDIFDTGTAGAYGLGGTGNYGCTVTSTALAVSGGTGTVTIRHADPTDAAKFIVGTTANVTFGGSPSTVTMTFDKATYSAGAAGTLTVNVKDSAGNNASDGVYATLFSGASTGNVTGSLPGAIVVVIGGKATSSVFMPNGAGTASVANTLGATIASKAGTAVSATATVTDGNAAIAASISALNAKIVALNALIAKIMKRLNIR